MGKLAVQKYFSFMMLIITFLLMIFTFVGLFGGDVPPGGNTARAMLVYALPLLIAGNAFFLIYWLVLRRFHWMIMPLVTLLCCIPYIGTLYKFGSINEKADAMPGFKISSYNVAMFGRETSGFMAQDILSEMKKQKVDIVCFQEYSDYAGDKKNSDSYKEYFPYMAKGRDDMMIFSRYPITKSKTIDFVMTNNSAMWADIDVNGRPFRGFNVHLQTTGINSALHRSARLASQGFQVESSRILSAIYDNYAVGIVIRSGQADEVAAEIAKSKTPVIVCGDFNDVPYSYVYNTMLGNLVDGFKECGHGFMYTWRGGNKRFVRIDYIFHDESMKGLDYYKYEMTYSDHFPVFMKLEI